MKMIVNLFIPEILQVAILTNQRPFEEIDWSTYKKGDKVIDADGRVYCYYFQIGDEVVLSEHFGLTCDE